MHIVHAQSRDVESVNVPGSPRKWCDGLGQNADRNLRETRPSKQSH